ncbi:MAG: hypothetical protein ACOWWM_05575 [Desulfobacterales bacterium]
MRRRIERSDYQVSSERPPMLTVALVSAGALAYEIFLARLMAVIQWHHFAFLVISLALLGYGASGTWISLFPRATREAFDHFFHLSAAGLAVSLWCSTRAAVQVPFNALEVLWSPIQWGLLAILILFMAVPFFFAGTLIGLTLKRFGAAIPKLYAADLCGAGAGALAMVVILFAVRLESALTALTGLAAAGTIASGIERPSRLGTVASSAVVVGLTVVLLLPAEEFLRRMTPYKPLAQALEVPRARVVRTASSPMGWIAVVESPGIPFRMVPGASLVGSVEPPDQLAVFTDGDQPDPITRFTGDPDELAFLDRTTLALPFHLNPRPERVVLPSAGMGTTVLLSYFHGPGRIEALELNDRKIRLLETDFKAFAGWRFLEPVVHYHAEEIRGFLGASTADFDLVLFPPVGAGDSPGVTEISESYELTLESVRACLRHLASGGMLSLSWWIRLPPRDGFRLMDTMVRALEAEGEDDPGKCIAAVRSWKTGTIVVRKGGLSADDIQAVRRFCGERSFDTVYFPGIREAETNRRTVLASNILAEGFAALAGPGREAFLERYRFPVAAVSDNRPFFHFYFSRDAFTELVTAGRRGGFALLEWGYPVLILTLVLACILSALLILLPVAVRKQAGEGRSDSPWRMAVYFSGIGMGFISLEMIFIQAGTRYLHHPVYAMAAVLTGFLVFAGIGSRTAGKLAGVTIAGWRAHRWAVAGIAVGAILGWGMIGFLADRFSGASLWIRIALVVVSMAPTAFFMGFPMPLGLSRLAEIRPDWIPWAWSINGFASVTGAIITTVAALHLGFLKVIAVAIFLYACAALVGPAPSSGDVNR